jgi:hypothetical protein
MRAKKIPVRELRDRGRESDDARIRGVYDLSAHRDPVPPRNREGTPLLGDNRHGLPVTSARRLLGVYQDSQGQYSTRDGSVSSRASTARIDRGREIRYFSRLAGALAQLGERCICNAEVTGSIPVGSTGWERFERAPRHPAGARFRVRTPPLAALSCWVGPMRRCAICPEPCPRSRVRGRRLSRFSLRSAGSASGPGAPRTPP